jgi:hypothetical protein
VTDGEKIEGSCSTGQSPQRAVVPMEEEEEEEEEEKKFKVCVLNCSNNPERNATKRKAAELQ